MGKWNVYLDIRAFVSLICLSVVVLSGISSAFAQSSEALVEARRLSIEAERLTELGDLDEARRVYADAFELSEDPELLYRIAVLNEDASNPQRAIRHYELYLDLAKNPVHRERIEARIERLGESVEREQAWVKVTSVPAGALVYVDDMKRVRCKTPCRVAVDPAESTIRSARTGYRPQTRSVYVAPSEEKSEHFDLEPIESNEELKVVIDGLEIDEEVARAAPVESTPVEESSQLTYMRSGPPTIVSFLSWIGVLGGFWSVVLAASPAFPDSAATLSIAGVAGLGIGGYFLFVHPWSPRLDPGRPKSGAELGMRFEF